MNNEKRILFYDIELSPVLAWIWECSQQYVNYKQILDIDVKGKKHDKNDIICIGYAWNDNQPAKVLGWGYKERDSKQVIQEFDKLVAEADIIVGKNNIAFDNKYIDTLRMYHGLPNISYPKVQDIEKDIKKNFRLQSNSLDYIAKMLGFKGKKKVTMDDWLDAIFRKNIKGYNKLLDYCKQDVEMTRAIYNKINNYTVSTKCQVCQGTNLKRNGTHTNNFGELYQNYWCNDCTSYAGKTRLQEL